MSVHIQIEQFEGPLGLLLHLIRREEMDIFDINIHSITKQYLDYIKAMKKLDLEVAGEFVAMAATLIQIKSRMLLPTYNEEGEVVETEDPRKVLVQKLLEYQKFQEAGQKLYDRPILGRDVWKRGYRLKVDSDLEEEIILEGENALFALIKAYRGAIKNMRKKTHAVVKSMQSISERVREIKHLLVMGKTHPMTSLMTPDENKNIDKILITFLTMLELAKVGVVSLFQSEVFGELYIDAKKPIVDDAISRVEEYDDGSRGSQKADALFDEAESQAQEQELKEQAAEDDQLDLGQLPLENPEEEESLDAATDEDIFAEEQKLMAEGAFDGEELGEVGAAIPSLETVIPSLESDVSEVMSLESEVLVAEAELAVEKAELQDAETETESVEQVTVGQVVVDQSQQDSEFKVVEFEDEDDMETLANTPAVRDDLSLEEPASQESVENSEVVAENTLDIPVVEESLKKDVDGELI